jgi:hypothetical protein
MSFAAGVFEKPVPAYQVEATHIGPTWARGEDGRFLLPKYTLGWQILRWINEYVLGRDGNPFTPTKEQARFILWWYAVDEFGRFVYRDGIFQRLKGHGKDPLIAVICLVEFLGPCRFGGWLGADAPDDGLKAGDPYGIEERNAWIQVAAVSKDQTRNTMKLFPGMISKKLMQAHGMNKLDIGKEVIYAHAGQRTIEAVTSSPRALEGGRPTLVIMNETHHWISSNGGHEMFEVIDRNSTKSEGGAARTLAITNAYEPSEDSVAQRQREAWEAEQAGESVDTQTLYDSLEAPEGISMRPPEAKEWPPASVWTPEERAYREACIRAWISAIVRSVVGDSFWLDVPGITNKILRRTTDPALARRFWFNNIVSAEDSWVDGGAVDAGTDPMLRAAREHERESDQLRLGWIVDCDDEIVMFFDGSKSDDNTALVGCRLEDGYTFLIGLWAKPAGEAGEGWLAPRDDVSRRVDEAFERFNVVAFWGDPSHTLDDDSTRYWDTYIDAWHRKYRDRIQKNLWAVQSGAGISSVMWDMTSPLRTEQFAAAAELVAAEIQHKDHEGHWAPRFCHDGHPALRAHLKNARRSPTATGKISIRKPSRGSRRKIDIAACVIGAQMLRRVALNTEVEQEEVEGGWVTAI